MHTLFSVTKATPFISLPLNCLLLRPNLNLQPLETLRTNTQFSDNAPTNISAVFISKHKILQNAQF
jgi:hypothetical protein